MNIMLLILDPTVNKAIQVYLIWEVKLMPNL